ncbi:eight transmembrane protein EpsH, putative exosortase [Pleurocapsa sp. PCC 7327]|uniref:cyanoexosortase B n=1 Tax=Pleurocapsa sp. PCC 7327 TaxID=118163 RepID=UPI00029FF86B|nr:cyanoexosortase B [Pleurocapsa sp. PCC 7327]AFY78652.1 eight transmembrane protein EpsH, putative exosortase [Pleurocapsa sp. PCC 7327]
MLAKQKFPLVREQNLFTILVIVLLGVLYAPILLHWYDGWLNKSISTEHEYFSHGLIGFPYAAYICWMQRKKWLRLENRSHPIGGFLLLLAAVFYLTGSAEFVNLSFPIILTGVCLWLKGLPGLRLQKFSLLLVLLATPNSVPYLITPYTLPLQMFIAGAAGFLLMQLGFNVTVDGIYLAVDGKLVEVAPYCAGLKMLFTSLYVALLLLHWTGNLSNRKKTNLLLIGAVVISIVANIIRNTLLSFFHGRGYDQLFKWLHDGMGGDLYSTAMLGAIVLLLNFLGRFDPVIESEKSESLSKTQES